MKPSSELLRLATAGSVDDGKSTLIGRLLHDTKSILEDQLEHVAETSERRGDGYLNLALLTDGLRAEREQGITIDVAYRYFQTGAAAGAAAIAGVNGTGASTLDPPEGFRGGRKFIIADTPGHEQYTRNMVTGASTADVSIVLVDARHGVSEQTRRHAYIASLLRIPHVVVAVNKMDLVDYAESCLRRDRRRLHRLGDAPGAARHPIHPDLGAEGRQRRRALDGDALVSGLVAALPP